MFKKALSIVIVLNSFSCVHSIRGGSYTELADANDVAQIAQSVRNLQAQFDGLLANFIAIRQNMEAIERRV